MSQPKHSQQHVEELEAVAPSAEGIKETIVFADDIHQHGTLDAVLEKNNIQGTALEDRQTALELALAADPGPGLWTWRTMRYWLIALMMCLNQGDHGFDSTVLGSINSMTQYQSYFNLAGEASTKTGVVFGIGAAGTLVGFIPSYFVPDKLGRRQAMFWGNILPIIGNILSAFARSYNELLAARIIGGMGFVGQAPQAYLAEIASPRDRGRVLGFYNSSYYIGQIIATGICIPFGRGTSNWAWRVPFILQAVPLIILMLSVFFIPESPRWLQAQGRHDQAARVLAYFHSRDNDVNSPLVKLEMQEIAAQISMKGAEGRWWDFRSIFSTRGHRYRFWLGVMNLIWSQFAGNGLITYWLPQVLNDAGVKSRDQQRVYTFINSITSLVGAAIGTIFTDHVGRRQLMLWGAGSCGVGMAIIGGLLSPGIEDSAGRQKASIGFLMLFMVCFSIGWTPLQSLYPIEILSYENRQKAGALRGLINIVIGCWNSFALPTILTRIAWKTMFVFMAFDIVGFIVIWIYAVEPKQLSLEDLDEVFDSANPKKTSLRLVKESKMKAREEAEGRGV